MKILVTGGTGVIGAAVVPALLQAGHSVRLLSRRAEREAASYPDGVEPFAADVTNREQLSGAADGCDGVLHLAGIVDEKPPAVTFARVNVDGTRNVVEACGAAGRPWLIHVSSLGADRSPSAYHRSKRQAEELVQHYSGAWLILRPGTVYGPGDETLSVLLKLVRALPVVPVVGDGSQPFQPLWSGDFARVVVQAVERPELFGRVLDLAGPEVTTSSDLLQRLGRITGRRPGRMPVPAWLARVGTGTIDRLNGVGREWLQRAGIQVPITSSKLALLVGGNVIPEGSHNALGMEFDVSPTPLQHGLELLADSVPVRLPGSGLGAISHDLYWAEIRGARVTAATLLNWVCAHLPDVVPVHFADVMPGVDAVQPGCTLTLRLQGRDAQVRVLQRTADRVTFVTVEGHPLAGLMQFVSEDTPAGIRFGVHVAAQPASLLDWLVMRPVGAWFQSANWRNVIRHVVMLSGGRAPDGVRGMSYPMSSDEAREFRASVERIVQERHRRTDGAPILPIRAEPARLAGR